MSEATQFDTGFGAGRLPAWLTGPQLPMIATGAITVLGVGYGLWAWLQASDIPVRLAERIEVVEALPIRTEPPAEVEEATAEPPPSIEVLEAPVEGPQPPAIGLAPAVAGAPPVDPFEALLVDGPYGQVPTVSGDQTSWTAYQRQSLDLSPAGRIALVVVGLGLDPELTEAAADLPADIALAFSPYGDRTAGWMRYARWRGHEVMMTLPLEPVEYPRVNPGPATLFKDANDDEIKEILAWLMGRGQGYVGFAGPAGIFGRHPDRFVPIARSLRDHGLALFELGGTELASAARPLSLPFQEIGSRLDGSLAPADIEAALHALERQAIAEGVAVAYTRPYPLVFRMIEEWAATLDDEGLALVPLTSTLPAHAG
ncbi:MAG: divergent polysaccharide deacetylase family protein [Pseudomonadota bacterium]